MNPQDCIDERTGKVNLAKVRKYAESEGITFDEEQKRVRPFCKSCGERQLSQERSEEIQKYVSIYCDPDYRMDHGRKKCVQHILDTLVSHGFLLDVGTGRGETVQMAVQMGFERAVGTEVVPYLCSHLYFDWSESGNIVFCDIAGLRSFPDQSFDHVMCFDVLEHLTDPDVTLALSQFERLARASITISAATGPSRFKGRTDLHISHRPAQGWTDLFHAHIGERMHLKGMCGASPYWQWVI